MFQQAAPVANATAGVATLDALPWRDPEQFGALLQRLEPRLRAIALRYTRNAEAASDVLQNAFEKVVRHASRFHGRSAVSTWIHRIVVNEALMWLRSERRHLCRRDDVDWEQLGVADPAASAPDAIAQRDACARLFEELERLTPEERLVLERCAMGGESYRDFAQATGDEPGAAKSRAFRARRKLEAALERTQLMIPLDHGRGRAEHGSGG